MSWEHESVPEPGTCILFEKFQVFCFFGRLEMAAGLAYHAGSFFNEL